MEQKFANPYPAGIDCLWVASDSSGNLAAFVTAGIAPIPIIALSRKYGGILELGNKLIELPQITEALVVDNWGRLDDFVSLSQRGFFTFDWRDVHRLKSEYVNGYEKVTVPVCPKKMQDLDVFLQNCVSLVKLTGVDFADVSLIKVQSVVQCAYPDDSHL